MKRILIVSLCTLIVLAAGAYAFERFFIRPWVSTGRNVQAIVEISTIEVSLTKILSDAGRSSLNDLFEPSKLDMAVATCATEFQIAPFEARVALYTRATYALLRHGRNAMTLPTGRKERLLKLVQQALDPKLVARLGSSYMTDLGNDDWGNPYRVYVGPWPRKMGPVRFRNYRFAGAYGDSIGAEDGDALTVTTAGEPPVRQGFPANSRCEVYIWSYGANGVSDQPRYDPTHEYAPPARQHYQEGAADEYLGGGDDINNWDRDQTFMAFYN